MAASHSRAASSQLSRPFSCLTLGAQSPYDEGVECVSCVRTRVTRLRNRILPVGSLPPRSTAGQLTLDQHIGVRIPGGQPTPTLLRPSPYFPEPPRTLQNSSKTSNLLY